MNQDDHALATGRIIGNLQTLELLIRLFLCEAAGQDIEFPTGAPSSMKDSYMANYLSLRQLIECYNRQLTKAETDCSIDMARCKSVTQLRTAGLCHPLKAFL